MTGATLAGDARGDEVASHEARLGPDLTGRRCYMNWAALV